ncbi:MAG TPA: hypothetical protein VK324_15450 [Tepidisphaeraceae bacterium]|nr:hypothetical protein [Tepidisphaeraceae bacterium]
MPETPPLPPAEELRRILDAYGPNLPDIMGMLERQFAVLHNRAQVLLALCGIVISTTGFSGRIIAGTNALAQWLIVAGVAFVLLSAAVVVWGVLHLRWLTMKGGGDVHQWLATSLAYRDRKTNAYRVGIGLMLLGLTLYVAAIAVMLTNPHVDGLPPR